VPERPYCSAWGETREEALAQVQDAIRGNIEVRLDTGRPIPEPTFRRTEMRQVNEAAEKFAEAIKESYQALADRSISAQGLNAQLTQDFFIGVINNLRTQAEGNRALSEDLIEQQRKQRWASKALAQELVEAHTDFLNSMFAYYRGNLNQTEEEIRR
jgi:predicted RNase H-like HicB family nuclease